MAKPIELSSEDDAVEIDDPALNAPSVEQPPQVQPIEVGDAAEVQELPSLADGSSYLTAINQSPLSVSERFNVRGLGNKKGELEYLKKRFEEVQTDELGNLVVKDKGLWHRVDPDNFGDVDPWTLSGAMAIGKGVVTAASSFAHSLVPGRQDYARKLAESDPISKELTSELYENAPAGLAIAASVATAPASVPAMTAGTVGTAFGVGAGAEALRTSLGRYEGTYVATPEEQLKDVSLEGTLNTLGIVIPAGVKPGKEWMAKQLLKNPNVAKTIDTLAKSPESLKNGVKNLFTLFSGRRVEHLDTMLENPKAIGTIFKEIGGSDANFLSNVALKKADTMKQLATEADNMLTEIYRKNQAALLKAAPKTFNANMDDVLFQTRVSMLNDNYVGLYAKSGDKLVPIPKREAVELFKQNSGKLPKDVVMQLHDQDTIIKLIQNDGMSNAAKIAFDDDSYKMLKSFWSQLDNMSGIKKNTGRRAANDILTANGILDDMTFKIRAKAIDESLTPLANKMAGYHAQIRSGVERAFEKHGMRDLFRNRQADYALMQDEMFDIIQASNKAKKMGNDQPFMSLVEKVTARAGKKELEKKSFNGVLKMAQEMGSKKVESIRGLQTRLSQLDAAEGFYPITNKGYLDVAATGLIAGGQATGQTLLTGGGAAILAMRSPRASMQVARAGNAAWQFSNQLTKLGTDNIRKVIAERPDLLTGILKTVNEAGILADQTEQELLSPLAAPPGGQ